MYLFRQLLEYESFTYTYLLADLKTKETVLIDPVTEMFERDLKILNELGLNLKFIIETHIHADHITGNNQLKKIFPQAKSVVNRSAKVSFAEVEVSDGDKICFGEQVLTVISTPGHTDSCTSYHHDNKLFTGDALLVRGCGRTDFQQGSSKKLFASVREKLFAFADNTLVYPAHDYMGRCCSTIGEEKQFNPRLKLTNSLQDFEKIMNELKLAPPKKIDISVPANLKGGI